MKWWPLTGIANFFTEKKELIFKDKLKKVLTDSAFKKSLHIFVIDAGNSNLLNFTIRALKSPQYNTHRFGIFFTETPRHADILIVLGPILDKMKNPLLETINQMPSQSGIVIINEETPFYNDFKLQHNNIIAVINKNISPEELLSLLLKIQKGD